MLTLERFLFGLALNFKCISQNMFSKWELLCGADCCNSPWSLQTSWDLSHSGDFHFLKLPQWPWNPSQKACDWVACLKSITEGPWLDVMFVFYGHSLSWSSNPELKLEVSSVSMVERHHQRQGNTLQTIQDLRVNLNRTYEVTTLETVSHCLTVAIKQQQQNKKQKQNTPPYFKICTWLKFKACISPVSSSDFECLTGSFQKTQPH